ncbi:MAG: DUF3445 domain-containing protein [Rhodobacteraceae bacterium]|nr:DUF3445 domain-containing protein [Paracoccaceae bacterium]
MQPSFHEICQSSLPIMPWLEIKTSRMPGVNPLEWQDWLIRDDAFGAQMAYRDHLLAMRREAVFDCNPLADAASAELLALILQQIALDPEYHVEANKVLRPDGVMVDLNSDHPLVIAGRLAQDDQCILLSQDGGQVLRGAVLCFPASWTLAEKMNRDMFAIHQPVSSYSDEMAKRVGRMFERIQPERPLWRGNNLIYTNPDLFQPRGTDQRRPVDGEQKWVRVERQALVRLPVSKALCFGIHSFVVPLETLTVDQRETLEASVGA